MNTTIAIDANTKNNLKLFGNKGQTYDDILKHLMGIAKIHGFYQTQKWILENEDFSSTDGL